jgi:hypothetical protein
MQLLCSYHAATTQLPASYHASCTHRLVRQLCMKSIPSWLSHEGSSASPNRIADTVSSGVSDSNGDTPLMMSHIRTPTCVGVWTCGGEVGGNAVDDAAHQDADLCGCVDVWTCGRVGEVPLTMPHMRTPTCVAGAGFFCGVVAGDFD